MNIFRKEKKEKSIIAIKEQRAAYVFLIPAFLGLSLITYLPLLAALIVGFTDLTVFMLVRGEAPSFVGLENFRFIFTNPSINFLNSIYVTIYFALFAIISSVIYSMFIAVLLNRKMPGRTFLRAVFYIPYILPSAAVMISWFFLLRYEGGLVNYILVNMGFDRVHFLSSADTVIPALVMIAVWTCGNLIVIFLAGLQNVPRVYMEAAEVDGANFWQRFWRITIPCMTPIIFFNMLMSLVVNLQVVVPALAVTSGGPGQSTMFMTYLLYHFGPRTGQYAFASAMAFVFFLISALLAAVIFLTSKSWIFYEGDDK
ncbi:MAG: sugar ABC transporter permease [Oscillospiraceae bacterium]|nr:sugar ABC transporter permease [Oscillospiraceae bacterium]